MATEREAKLSAPARYAVPDLSTVVKGLDAVAVEPVELTATYYDTADLRLTRAGISLRHRIGGDESGWTVKLPDRNDGRRGATRVREEVHADGPPNRIPPALAALVRAHARSEPVKPVRRLVTRRQRIRLVGADGVPVVEVDDDQVSVFDGRRLVERFREIEVEELGDGASRALDRVVKCLREAGAGDAESTSKIARALGDRALEPPDLHPAPLDATSTATDLVRASIVNATRRLLRHDPGVRLGDDAEDVHQARVATRRLRSDLRTYRRLLDPEWDTALRDELKWAAAELGAVRDADVLYERLSAHIADLPDADRAGGAALLERLSSERGAARAELDRAMNEPRWMTLIDRLHEAAADPKLLPDLAAIRASEAVNDLVRRPWKHLVKAVDGLDADPSPDELHQVRIRAKRLRYALEAVAPIAGKQARKWSQAVAQVQEVLGDLHDAVVAEEWLRGAAAAAETAPAEALAAGQLVAVQRGIAADRTAAWRDAWKDASSKKRRAFLG